MKKLVALLFIVNLIVSGLALYLYYKPPELHIFMPVNENGEWVRCFEGQFTLIKIPEGIQLEPIMTFLDEG